MGNKVQDSWRERFEYIYVVEENKGEKYLRKYDHTTIVEELEYFISQELDKAREEGRRELVKEIREAIREDMNKDWDIEKRHIAIDEDIVRIINDGEITEMYTEGEEELKDGGWGWYS